MSERSQRVGILLILVLGTVLRFGGLDWGIRDLEGYELDGKAVSINDAGFNADADALHRAAESLNERYYPFVEYAGQPYLFTSYGTVFLYLHRIAASFGSWFGDYEAFGSHAADANPTRLAGRWASALAGVALIWVTWLVGRIIVGSEGALLGALLVAVMPMSVQAAHLATVDGLLGLWYALALYASVMVVERAEVRDYVLAGVAIGLAVATKINGLFLFLPLCLAHLLREAQPISMAGIRRAASSRTIYGAAGTAVLTWIVLTPAALFQWESYFFPEFAGPYHVSFSLRKTSEAASAHRGWLHLEGASTYFHHPLHVFPNGMGWVVQVALLAGIVASFVKRSPKLMVVAVSFLVYYVLVARLPDKPIRFFVPLAAYASVLVAHALLVLTAHRSRSVFAIAVFCLLLEPAVRSTALAGTYVREDSRVAAGGWIQQHIPDGATLMLERGHNGLAPLVSRNRFSMLLADLEHELWNSRGDEFARQGHFTAIIESEFLSQADWFALSEERISIQKVRPSAEDFYRRLFDGELGFELQVSFSGRPQLLGYELEDANTDLNWTRYDHPTTHVFERIQKEPLLYASNPDLSVYRLRTAEDAQIVLRRAQEFRNFAFFKRCLPASWKAEVGERGIADRFYNFLKDPSTLSGRGGEIMLIREGETWRVRPG